MFDNIRLHIGLVVLFLLTVSLGLIISPPVTEPVPDPVSDTAGKPIFDNFGKLPLSLIENQGQADTQDCLLHPISRPEHVFHKRRPFPPPQSRQGR